jgi:hypothetical protein
MLSDFGRLTIVGAAGLAALLAAVPVLAAPSTAGDDPGFANSGLTTVPAVTGRGFSIKPQLRTVYDTNILRLGDGQTPTLGGKRADLRFSPVVNLSVGLPVGRQQLFVAGGIGRDIFVENTQLNRNRFSIGGGVNLRAASRCTATLAADFNSRQVLATELAELVPNLQETLSYGGTANCQLPAGLGFGGTVRRIQLRNDMLNRQALDFNSSIYSAQLSYAIGNIGNFSVSGNLNKVGYPNRPVILLGGTTTDDGVDIISGRFGYQREIGSRLALTLGTSYLSSRPQPGTILQFVATLPPALPGITLAPLDRAPFTGTGYDASITYRPSSRMTTVFQASRDVRASANVGAQFQVLTSFGADIDYQIGSSLTAGLGATFNKHRYFNGFLINNFAGRRIEDKISRVYGSIVYAPVKLYALSVEVAYQKRASLPVDFSFDSVSAVLALRLNFGRES